MKGLILVLLNALAIISYAQELAYPSLDTLPSWVRTMYSATSDADISKTIELYEAYYADTPLIKNEHTQYYKRWIRGVSKGLDAYDLGIETLNKVDEERKNYISKLNNNTQLKRSIASWVALGPFNYDENSKVASYAPGATHVYTVEQSKSNPNIVVAGTATAGVWKSIDKGNNWSLITETLLVNEVKAVEINHANPDKIYFGGGGFFFKTSNGGSTWKQIVINGLGTTIYDIVQKKDNPSTLFLACDKGLFRSTNEGENWSLVLPASSNNEAYHEIEVHPSNSNIVYAVKVSGNKTMFYKSTNGGASFSLKSNGWPDPDNQIGAHQRRTEIAVTPAHPSYIYALAAGQANGAAGLYGFYMSTDEGENWTFTCCGNSPGGKPNSTNNKNILGYSTTGAQDGGQYYYDLSLAVSETAPVWVIAGGINLWRSTSHGSSWSCNNGWTYSNGDTRYVHADIQDIRFSGNDMWVASDGGLYHSTNKGAFVNKKMHGIQGTDFKGFDAGGLGGDLMIGGTYHNSTLLKHGDTYQDGWVSTALGGAGGDNTRGFVHPAYDNVAFMDKNGSHGRIEVPSSNQDELYTFPFAKQPNASYIPGKSSNIAFHPHYYNQIYSGVNNELWMTKNQGNSWALIKAFEEGKIVSIDIATSNPDYIYVALISSSSNGVSSLWRSSNGGESWTKITPSNISQFKDYPFKINVSASDHKRLWLARISPYATSDNLNGQKVYTSHNGGSSWINITGSGLYGEKITNIVNQKGSTGIYIGTRRTVYYKDDYQNHWSLYNQGLPASTHTANLSPYYYGNKLRIGTNRGAYEIDFNRPSSAIAIPSVDRAVGDCTNKTFKFQDLSTISSAGATWEWSFPGASPANSNSRAPIVTYESSGQYDVTLKVTSSQGTNTKTLENMITIQDGCGTSAPDDFAGKAFYSDGSKAKLELPALGASHGTISISAWVKLDAEVRDKINIMDWEKGSFDTGFYINANRNLEGIWNGGTGIASRLTVPVGKWTHVAFVVKNNSMSFYVNGVEHTVNTSQSNYSFSVPAAVGSAKHNSNASIEGSIDELSIWDRPLSLDEIRLMRHLTIDNPSTNGLISYYQFNEDGVQVEDKAGRYHGNLYNNASLQESNVPVGGGASEKITVSSNSDLISNKTGVSIMFDPNNHPVGDFVLTRIFGHPDHTPFAGPYSNDYWIINNYSDKTKFSALDMIRFDGIGPISNSESSNPTPLVLLKRESNAFGDSWGTPIDNADVAYAGNMGDVVFSYNNNITEFSQFFITRASILPVELISFDAYQGPDNTVEVAWTTTNEIDLERYEVERSRDGVSFEQLGFLFAKGVVESTDYDFVDYDPFEGNNYYRLKSVDLDGQYSYSDIKSISINKENTKYQVYPNPAEEHVNVIINEDLSSPSVILLLNQQGQKLMQIEINRDTRLNTSALPAGLYHLIIRNERHQEHHKIVIQ